MATRRQAAFSAQTFILGRNEPQKKKEYSSFKEKRYWLCKGALWIGSDWYRVFEIPTRGEGAGIPELWRG